MNTANMNLSVEITVGYSDILDAKGEMIPYVADLYIDDDIGGIKADFLKMLQEEEIDHDEDEFDEMDFVVIDDGDMGLTNPTVEDAIERFIDIRDSGHDVDDYNELVSNGYQPSSTTLVVFTSGDPYMELAEYLGEYRQAGGFARYVDWEAYYESAGVGLIDMGCNYGYATDS